MQMQTENRVIISISIMTWPSSSTSSPQSSLSSPPTWTASTATVFAKSSQRLWNWHSSYWKYAWMNDCINQMRRNGLKCWVPKPNETTLRCLNISKEKIVVIFSSHFIFFLVQWTAEIHIFLATRHSFTPIGRWLGWLTYWRAGELTAARWDEIEERKMRMSSPHE